MTEKDDVPEELEAGSPEPIEPSLEDVLETPENDVQKDEVATLTEELDAAKAGVADMQNRMLRMQADMENTRKRLDQKADDARRYGQKSMIEELLPICDSMEMGVAAANEEGAEIGKIREGYELTSHMLNQLLTKFNVEEVNPVGEKFDPDLHQAMSMQEGTGQEANTVVMVMQKGYTLNTRLIRPALVMVAK